MRSNHFRLALVLGVVLALASALAATAAAGPKQPPSSSTSANGTSTTPASPPAHSAPPATGAPFPSSTNVSNFPAGQITVRVKFDDATVTDGGWAHYTLYVANRTPKTMLFTKTALAVGLDGQAWSWAQTSGNTGGFGFADNGQYWIRSGTLRPGRVIKITGTVQTPKRTKYVAGNPMRDATLACVQAVVRQAALGQPEANWPQTFSVVDRHSCAQYGSK